jgi:hypothetical protein
MALVAEQELGARGVRLGNPDGAAALRRAGRGGAPLRSHRKECRLVCPLESGPP